MIEETDASGNLVNDYIYGAGMRLARKDASGNVSGYISDPLGSVRYIAGPSGTHAESDWYPFGGERVISDTLASPNKYKFTGMERDTDDGAQAARCVRAPMIPGVKWGRWTMQPS